jgi:hypothetical protein
MDSIRDWLNGNRDYATGVVLYNLYGDNDAVKQMLAQGATDYRKGKLVEHLQAVLQTAKPVTIQIAKVPKTVYVKRENTPDARVPEEQDAYRKEWLPLFMEMNNLRHKLRLMPTDEERCDAAFEVLRLQKECMKIWAKRDYELQYGKQPEVKNTGGAVPTNELKAQQLNLRTYVTKYKKLMDANPLNEKYSTKYETYKVQLDAVNERLKNMEA